MADVDSTLFLVKTHIGCDISVLAADSHFLQKQSFEFIGGSINLALGVEGGAVAPALTSNPVYSEIIAVEGLGGGAGVGNTWYKQLSEGWVYGEAPINRHNPRLSYPFGAGTLIANSNNFCQSSV